MSDAALHASCVLVGEAGILLRGASGSGKSHLGDAIVETARARGRFAAHVADDRVYLRPCGDRLIATCPEPIAGLWEYRGRGVLSVPFERKAVLRLVIDLRFRNEIERLPEARDLEVSVAGIVLPRYLLPTDCSGDSALGILRLLGNLKR